MAEPAAAAPPEPAAPAASAPEPTGGQGRLRVVTFNVNGLRACLRRRFATVKGLLEELGADIVCLQETKLRRGDLDRELALEEGWESFFACSSSPMGYSGTATYVRSSLAMPLAAAEGFTGCCTAAAAGGAGGAGGIGAAIHPALAEQFTVDELQELDGEGRVVITDHDAFVLFNIYGPALTGEDEEAARLRADFKLRFYRALQLRFEDYLRKGRAVIVVGDLNISPAPIDSCKPSPEFYTQPHRMWLTHLLHGPEEAQLIAAQQRPAFAPAAAAAAAGAAAWGLPQGSAGSAAGRFVDAFRAFHPTRREAYSCWNTKTGARENNFGVRLDLVLAAGVPLLGSGSRGSSAAAVPDAAGAVDGSSCNSSGCGGGPDVWLSGCDIMVDTHGSDHAPVWADFTYCGRFPCAAAPPPCSSSRLFAGKQLKLQSFFAAAPKGLPQQCLGSEPSGQQEWDSTPSSSSLPEGPSSAWEGGQGGSQQSSGSQLRAASAPPWQQQQQTVHSGGGGRGAGGGAAGPSSLGSMRRGGGVAGPGKKQASLFGFLAAPPAGTAVKQAEAALAPAGGQLGTWGGQAPKPAAAAAATAPPLAAGAALSGSQHSGARSGGGLVSAAEAKNAWQQIQQRMSAPLCRHGEPSVRRKTTKQGENKGRWFFGCARAAGPPPHGQCGFFQWVEPRPGDFPNARNSGGGGGGSGSGGAKRFKPSHQ